MKKNTLRIFLQVLIVALLVGVGLGYPKSVIVDGETMGTTYRIKANIPFWRKEQRLHQLVEQRLQQITDVFSTYEERSHISLFNQHKSTTPIEVHPELYDVLKKGAQIYEHTQGAWDATILPIYRVWGFMDKESIKQAPSQAKIQQIKASVGFDKLKFVGPQRIQKGHPDLEVDLSSIAKGYAVDDISRMLKRLGSQRFLVEIGGEIYASGKRSASEPWRCGINVPQIGADPTDILLKVALKDKGLATSGDYRNFITIKNKRYPHIIDPKTGTPIRNTTVSATVIAETCMLADALATAAMVLSPKEAIEMIEKNKSADMLVIEKTENGYKRWMSSGFQDYIINEPLPL